MTGNVQYMCQIKSTS